MAIPPTDVPSVVVIDPAVRNRFVPQVLECAHERAPAAQLVAYTSDFSPEFLETALEVRLRAYFLKGPVHETLLPSCVELIGSSDLIIVDGSFRDWFESEPWRLRFEAAPPSSRALSVQEEVILRLLADGLFDSDIARQLSVKETTVRTHISRIEEKLEARHRAHAIAIAIRRGLIDPMALAASAVL